MKKIIIPVLVLFICLFVFTTKLTKTYALENNSDEDIISSEYYYNYFESKNYLEVRDLKEIYSLRINNLGINYRIGILNDHLELNGITYLKGSIYLIITKIYIEYKYSLYKDSYLNEYTLTNYYNLEGESNNFYKNLNDTQEYIYLNLQYDDIMNGNVNIKEINLNNYIPEVYINTFTNRVNDDTYGEFSTLNTYISFSLYQGETLQKISYLTYGAPNNPPFNKITGENYTYTGVINFSTTLKDTNYIYIDTLVKNYNIRTYLLENPPENKDLQNYDNVMSSIFNGFASILSIEVFPNITIGLIIGLPLLLGALLIILKFIRG